MSTEQDPPAPERPASAGDEPLVQPADDTSPEPGTAGAGEEPEPAGAEAAGASSSPLPSASLPDYESPASIRSRQRRDAPNMLPGRDRRRTGIERLFVRLIATGGIVGIGVAIAAIMVSSKSQGWVIGLVVSIVTVVLAAILWSSRQL
jgi:hypothetical protein